MSQTGHRDAAPVALTDTVDQTVHVTLAVRVGDAGTAAVAEFEAPPSDACLPGEALGGRQVAIHPL